MSGLPQSFQRRTEDLYMLKTRNLVYQDVIGTYPTQGAMGYVTNTVGSVGWSSAVTTNPEGDLTVKGTTTLGANGVITVDGGTGNLTTTGNVDIGGELTVTNTATVQGLNLINLTDLTSSSQLCTFKDTPTTEQLQWRSTLNNTTEPISGWSVLVEPAAQIFRTVDTSGLSGATLTLAQNMNALLNLFLTRGIFVQTLTNTTGFATVFNTPVSIRFNIGIASFTYTPPSGSAIAVPYSTIVAGLNAAAVAASVAPSVFTASYIGGKIQLTIPLGTGQYWTYTNTATNGTAQFFMNHIGFTNLSIDVLNFSPSVETPSVLQDFSVIMPAAPSSAPTNPVPTDISCSIVLPAAPTTPPIAIQQIGIYWCVSGGAFSTYPNALVSTGTSTYTIAGLSANTSYKVALSYRSLYDESPKGPELTFKTIGLLPAIFLTGTNMYSVELTEDVNWLATPSYGSMAPNYGKSYVSGVKFNVAMVYSAVWTDTLNDLTQISQIQSVTIEFYAGATSATTDARFYTGSNPQAKIIDHGSTVSAKYGDTAGVGGSIIIVPDADGLDILHEIFNADEAGVIDTTKNMSFGWFCSQGGLRNCEMMRFNVIYMSMGPGPDPGPDPSL